MPDRGEDLGVDLYQLWLAGTKYLPAIAGQFAQANNGLRSAEAGDDAWARAGLFGSNNGPAYAGMVELRGQLTAITEQMTNNLYSVSAALVLAAQRYQVSDDAARQKFLSMLADPSAGEY